MKENIYDIWLSQVKGIGLSKKIELIQATGSSYQLYKMNKEELRVLSGWDARWIDPLYQDKNLDDAKKILEKMEKLQIQGVGYFDNEYPKELRHIYNPPLYLYVKGRKLKADETEAVAIIGSRKGSAYGRTVAYELAKKLSQSGSPVISGMAYGIDSYAHRGSVENGGYTIAVLGSGVNICYPKKNRELMEQISNSGSVISEYPPDTMPFPAYFPARNRIISGLSKAIVIIEAGEKSGTLITAELGLEQGKDIYALPGNIYNVYSIGTNRLIKEGATPICSIEEFLVDLNITNPPERMKYLDLGKDETRVYDIIKSMQPVHKDILAYKLQKEVLEIAAIISILEIKGLVESTYAGIIAK
ncbi:MAG: DNA-processing protein DprA [Peptostreptococcales bacterium]